MSHRNRILAAACALAAVLAIPVFGAASAPGQAQAEQVITVFGTRGQFTLPGAPTVGATFLAGGELADARKAPVGRAVSSCTLAEISTAVPPVLTAHCSTVFRLDGGDIHMSSLREYANGTFKNTTFAVTGGTGEYSAARGQTRAVLADSKAVVYRFDVTLTD
ncbi:hypothetical protein [Actinokineospora sp. UTMC 2448]|uniref:hypothetical protein n=1 Tax=Actinokineospora sp. UTMC 2448 TaxID=2268449 RepID=UPI002164833F|nr:hypothetical protein [Actinokineospora sp. UTMC 2448]UVS76953.1 hypothetical protein Actkin_00650 [Actinokineospora sp. UTMC 2448]